MLSPNIAIRTAYNTYLSTITYDGNPVPVFWSQLPTDQAPGIYIIFGSIRNIDDGNKTAAVTQTSVTVSIYTNSMKYNDGVAVDTVGNEVLNRLKNTQAFNITLDAFFKVIVTTLTSDQTQDFSVQNQNTYIDRVMIFNHRIFQNPS